MKTTITVRVNTRSRNEGVESLTGHSYRVRVNTPPVDGKANERVQELLAEYFRVPKTKVILVRGHKNKLKVFEIK